MLACMIAAVLAYGAKLPRTIWLSISRFLVILIIFTSQKLHHIRLYGGQGWKIKVFRRPVRPSRKNRETEKWNWQESMALALVHTSRVSECVLDLLGRSYRFRNCPPLSYSCDLDVPTSTYYQNPTYREYFNVQGDHETRCGLQFKMCGLFFVINIGAS